MTTTKLPVRRNIEPLFRIASELESHLQRSLDTKNEKILKKFSANFNGCETVKTAIEHSESSQLHPLTTVLERNTESADEIHSPAVATDDDDYEPSSMEINRLSRKKCKLLLQEKDEQIEKLIDRLTHLHNSNTEFAVENAELQRKLQTRIDCTECTAKQRHYDDKLQSIQCDYDQENRQLCDDIKMMKSLVYRLNVQLERYQAMLRAANAPDAAIGRIDFDGKDLNWGPVNAHTLSPLLHAYTEIIDEKNDLVQQYENEVCHFTGRLKSIVEENDTLQRQMDAMKMATEAWMVDKTRLNAQTTIFRYAFCLLNVLFVGFFKDCNLFLSLLRIRSNKAEVQTKRADVAKDKLVEVLRCYEQKIQVQHLELERLNEAYARAKGELTGLRSVQQSPPEVIVESLRECQKYVDSSQCFVYL